MLYNPAKTGPAIVVGDACVDITIKLDYYMDGNEHEKEAPPATGGGTSSNSAVALQKLGVPTAFMGTVGNDYGGRFMVRDLKENGVDTTFTIMDPELNTVLVFAFIQPSGERMLKGFPKEAVSYAELDLDKVDLDGLRNARWFHSSGMNLMNGGSIMENLPKLYKIAYEAGVPTSFDLNTRYARPEDAVYTADPQRENRKVPSKRLAARVEVLPYYHNTIRELVEDLPQQVRIPLRMHIGAPSVPVVAEGDYVSAGQLIANCPDGALGSAIHASISGRVVSISDTIEIISEL